MNNLIWPYYSVKYNKNNWSRPHKFFVEVVYDAKHNVITELRSFKYGHSLDKYAPRF